MKTSIGFAAALVVAAAVLCCDEAPSGPADGAVRGDADAPTDGDADHDGPAGDGDGDADADDGASADGDEEDSGPVARPLTCAPIECGPSDGATIALGPEGDLQAAIDAAAPGDTIVLEAGATFTGHFVLRAKEGEGCITIRTSTPDDDLPEGERVNPEDAGRLARIVTPGSGLPAIRTEPRAHHYRLVGLEILPESASAEVYELVALGSNGSDQDTLADVPHHLSVERCFVHGWPDANFKRGIGLNSASTCIIDSTVSDFHSDFQDSQAIGGVNGPGPFRIVNNRLEGSAENVMFGGAVPSIPDLVPSDIEILRNHFFKPLAWRAGDPANTGYVPWAKNLFEIKNGRNVVLDGNLLENSWVGADQHGYAIVLTPRGEGGAAPWATVENVRIANNVVRHVGGGIQIAGHDNAGPSQQTNHITVANNVFEDIRQDYALDMVRVLQFSGVDTLVVEHNTFQYATPTFAILRSFGEQTTGFAYEDNVVTYGEGVWADCGSDSSALTCSLPGASFRGNVVIGGGSASLPSDNFFPASIEEVGFVDFAAGALDYHNYALAPGSPYAGQATDGTDPGIDAAAIDAARGTSAPP